MKRKKIWIWAFVLVVSLFLSGCGPKVIRLYSGPELTDDQVATLTWFGCEDLIVDGEDLEFSWVDGLPEIIKLLPGLHEITWTWRERGASWIYWGSGMWDAKAGHIYDVYFAYLPAEPPLKFGENPIADCATWLQDRYTAEVVIGDKPSWAGTGTAIVRSTR